MLFYLGFHPCRYFKQLLTTVKTLHMAALEVKTSVQSSTEPLKLAMWKFMLLQNTVKH